MHNRDIVKKNATLPERIHFKINTALGFPVQTTAGYWKIITTVKHPSIVRKEREVKNCLSHPDEIRTSKKDRNVYLFYKKSGNHFLCVVIKYRPKGSFIITSYLTDKIKEGELKWKK